MWIVRTGFCVGGRHWLTGLSRFGWVNASYVVGLEVLDKDLRKSLEDMISYDAYKKAFGQKGPNWA